MSTTSVRRSHGFSALELVVVMAILGILAALLFPAVQQARESSRGVACQSNLRQIGIAIANHNQSQLYFPSNGWGSRWVGEPDRGVGPNQPGGWIYNVLPYVEQSHLRELAHGLTGAAWEARQTEMLRTPVKVFQCPSRRLAIPYPFNSGGKALVNLPEPAEAAKSDYAGNSGDVPFPNHWGPLSTSNSFIANYAWPSTVQMTGIFFLRSSLTDGSIRDGTSHTYMVGEKYVNPIFDPDPGKLDVGDNQTMYLGDSWDIRRSTYAPPSHDIPGVNRVDEFGSSHPQACFFLFCDGSVRGVKYRIDYKVHRQLGNRRDGEPTGFDF